MLLMLGFTMGNAYEVQILHGVETSVGAYVAIFFLLPVKFDAFRLGLWEAFYLIPGLITL